MRYLVTADLHFSNCLPYSKMDWETGVSDRLRDFDGIADFLIRTGSKHDANHLLILGDTFDRNLLDAVTLAFALKFVRRLAKHFESVTILPGNHENHDARNLYFTTYWLSAIKRVVVPTTVMTSGPFVFLPYLPIKKAREALRSLTVDRATKILLTHATFAGAKNFGHVLKDGLTAKDVEGFRLVLSGHIHNRQPIRDVNGYYVGSPYAVDFKDESTKTVSILDTDKATTLEEFVPADVSPPFRTVEVDLFDDGSIKAFPKSLPKPGGYLKVRVRGTKPAVEKFVDGLRGELKEGGYRNVSYDKRIVRDVSKARSAALATKGGVDLRQALTAWVDSLELPEHLSIKKLKKVGQAILGSALSEGTERPRKRVSVEPISLQISNFGPIESAKLRHLTNAGLVLIRGRNKDSRSADSVGSGKSHVFKAWCWVLFGKTIYGETGNDVIRKGQDKASVRSVWRVDGELVKISRFKTLKGSPLLTIKRADGTKLKGGVTELQREIDEMLGLDFEAFRNTVLFGQNDHKRFADPATSDTTRKAIFREILRLSQLDVAKTHATKKRKQASEAIEERKLALARVESSATDDRVSTLKAQANDWEAERKEEIERIRMDGRKWQAVLDTSKDKSDFDVDAVKKEAAKLNELIATQQVEAASLLDMSKAFARKGNEELTELRTKHARLKTQKETVKAHLAKLDGDRCPICNSDLSKGDGADHKDTLTEELSNLNKLIEKVTATIETKKDGIAKRNAAFDKESEELETRRQETIDEFSSLRDSLQAKSEIKNRRDEAKRHLATMRERIASEETKTNPYSDLIAKARQERKEAKAEVERLQFEVESLESTYRLLDFWVDGFGIAGLQSWIMDSTVAPLNESTNSYLGILADGDISVEIDTESKTKKGESRDKFSITATIEQNGETMPSGGQQCKIALACGLGLMDLVGEREGSNVRLLMLDEIFDGLDQSGKERVIDLLAYLRERKGTVMVISHDPELRSGSEFDRILLATKRSGAARVTG